MLLLIILALFCKWIINHQTTLTCLQIRNTEIEKDMLPKNFFQFNLVQINFDCTKPYLAKSACLHSVSNASVHVFKTSKNLQRKVLEYWNNIIFFRYRDDHIAQTEHTKNIINVLSTYIHPSNTYVKETIYNKGKLLVPTKPFVKTKYNIHRRNHIKRGTEVTYYLAIPINKHKTLYYQYDVTKKNNIFTVSNVAETDSFAYICNRENTSTEIKQEFNKLLDLVNKNIDISTKSDKLYLIDVHLIQYHSYKTSLLEKHLSKWSILENITPYECKDRIIIDKYLGRLFIHENAAKSDEKNRNISIKLKNIRLEDTDTKPKRKSIK